MDTLVTLDRSEMLLAAYVGICRQIKNLDRGVGIYGYMGNGWDTHIEGAFGEMAVAKTLDRYWSALVNDMFSVPGDVGRYQVRTCPQPRGQLLLHPSDPDDAPFILAVRIQSPPIMRRYRLVGWIVGAQGKQDRFWRELQPGRPCFVVPQDRLQPMEALP